MSGRGRLASRMENCNIAGDIDLMIGAHKALGSDSFPKHRPGRQVVFASVFWLCVSAFRASGVYVYTYIYARMLTQEPTLTAKVMACRVKATSFQHSFSGFIRKAPVTG